MAEKKIQDMGEKIGGARKDVWSARGLLVTDLTAMNDSERNKYAKKQYVWPQPNWKKMYADGEEQVILYWKNEMRKAFPPAPRILITQQHDAEAARQSQENYVAFCAEYRKAVMSCTSKESIQSFLNDFLVAEGYAVGVPDYSGRIRTYRPTDKAAHCLNDKMLNLACLSDYNYERLTKEAANKYFAVDEDEKTYLYVKNNLKAVKLDGEFASVEKDSNSDCARIVLRSGHSMLFCYDRESRVSDYQDGSYMILNLADHTVAAKNLPSLEACTEIIESSARALQAKEDQFRKENKEANSNERKRKKAFSLQRLESMGRVGPDYLAGNHAGEKDFLQELGFRAVEFGNWVGDAERQQHLDMTYNSMCDLANVLGIDKKDVSLDGRLALAFGSRGQGGLSAGAAHYEPFREVINLTKLHGAGCLAHELGHALDDSLGKLVNAPRDKFLSDVVSGHPNKETLDKLPPAFADIMKMMKYKTVSLTQDEAEKIKQCKLDFSEKVIRRWADSLQIGKDCETKDLKWERLVNNLLESANDVTGLEYISLHRGSGESVYMPLEELSKYRKSLCGYGILKADKQEVVRHLRNYQTIKETPIEEFMRGKTEPSEYYKGSKAFDQIYSRCGAGYWSSEKEMFARAWDCYIEDKLKAAGLRSDYLTSHASAYKYPGPDGTMVYAIPVGEERKALDAKFDELLQQAKERGIFHEAEVTQENERQVEEVVPTEQPKQPEPVPAEEKRQDALETERQKSDIPETVVNRFAASAAVYAVAPRVMDSEQKEQWRAAVRNVITNYSVETLQALSNLRQNIVGRGIPPFNLRQIGRTANAMLEKEAERHQPKPEQTLPEEKPRQMSFEDYER